MQDQDTPIAKEGYPFIAMTGFAALFLVVFSWKLTIIPALFASGLTLFVVYFFRNPRRVIPEIDNAVVAPADGLIIYLGKAYEDHLHTEMLKISIFMSVFNVHVNRVPFSGRVQDIFYKRGKFLDARDDKATFENEQNGIILDTGKGFKLVFVQVAGLIARRIVCYPKKGDLLQRGDRYGLIRFGSRVDVYLPQNINLQVAVGDKTTAGETILGYVQ